MNKLTGLVFLLFLTIGMGRPGGATADSLATLHGALAGYKEASLKRNVEGIMAYFPPAMFEQMPKGEMRQAMSRAFADGKAPHVTNIIYGNISPIKPFSKGQFALVDYTREMTMQRPGDVTPEIDGLMFDLIKKRLGEPVDLSIDAKNNVILIKKQSGLLALDEGGAWKFIDRDKLGIFKQNKLLPADLLTQLR